jgi:hypothetical protein
MKYTATEDHTYYSPRYGKSISWKKGDKSDGATYAPDISFEAFFAHDVMCERGTWDDGTPCTRWEASNVYSDILKSKGKWAWTVSHHRKWATYWFGGKKLQKK